MRGNCLAHVFHLSAKVLLAGIEIYNVDNNDDDFDIRPAASTNARAGGVCSDIALTVEKMSCHHGK
jgi:hypothetical protein